MLPSLENGDYLVLRKPFLNDFEYKKNDIIIFKANIKSSINNKRDLVKRVIATEGDHIVIYNNTVYINDEKIEEDYILESKMNDNLDIYIDEDCYFVMGDNRKVSLDSRNKEIGVIKEDDILGKVIIKMFPFEKFEGDENENWDFRYRRSRS